MSPSIARQAIFNRENQLVAYELLFREESYDVFPIAASGYATEIILNDLFVTTNSVTSIVSDGKTCYINFSYQNLINRIALNYSPNGIVIEVLENCIPDSALFEALIELKNKGYCIAFDDFKPSEDWRHFLPLADIIKLDFRALSYEEIRCFILEFKTSFDFLLLAEKIETQEELQFAKKLGFDLFQGFQLGKPERLPFPHVA